MDPCFWLNNHQSSIILPLANGRTLHASPLATGRQRYFPSMPRPFGARIRWRFFGIDGPLKGVIYIYRGIADSNNNKKKKKKNKQTKNTNSNKKKNNNKCDCPVRKLLHYQRLDLETSNMETLKYQYLLRTKED